MEKINDWEDKENIGSLMREEQKENYRKHINWKGENVYLKGQDSLKRDKSPKVAINYYKLHCLWTFNV